MFSKVNRKEGFSPSGKGKAVALFNKKKKKKGRRAVGHERWCCSWVGSFASICGD